MATKQGPTPGQVVVACSYYTQENLQELLNHSRGSEARELNTRLQGVSWLDSIRQALELPIQTFCTAAEKFQRFNLKYNTDTSNWNDVAATALSLACKVEDTQKKPKDVLCAAYNLKKAPTDKVTPDHDMFSKSVTVLTGLERLMLENSAFDFRTRYPHLLISKIAKLYGLTTSHRTTVVKTAFYMGTDSYRTWAPLKHTPSAIALACLELSGRLHGVHIPEIETCKDYAGNGRFPAVTRPMVMECMLDMLDLYTHNRSSTIEGANFPIDQYISIRIALNQEANDHEWPRFMGCSEAFWSTSAAPSPNEPEAGLANGRSSKTTPTSPATVGAPRARSEVATPLTPGRPAGREMTMRFILERRRATEEKLVVDEYLEESEEEYEMEVEETVEVVRPPDDRDDDPWQTRDGREAWDSRDTRDQWDQRESRDGRDSRYNRHSRH